MIYEVDEGVQRAKFAAEIKAFDDASPVTRNRGCHLLSATFPVVHLAITNAVPIAGNVFPLVMVSVVVNFTNFDIEAPSLRFADVVTGTLDVLPTFPIFAMTESGEQQQLVLTDHPTHHRPFLCHPGIREYHDHPAHDGEPWLATRDEGRHVGLVWLCDFLWSNCVARLPGINVRFVPVLEAVPSSS